jgi:hypothetical protein
VPFIRYRTPLSLRSFARIFTLLLPPFYAPTFAQVARDVQSLGVGILFGFITAIALTALFESLQVLEDPFTGYIALDGIDVREEFEVLLFTLLKNTRKVIWPDAPPYPLVRRAALTASCSHKHLAGVGGVATSTSPSNNGGVGGITPPRVSTPSPSEHSAETTAAAAASMWGQFSNANENVTDQESDNESVEFGNPLQEAEGASTVRESNYTEGGYHHARNRSRTSGGGDDGKLFGLGLWASE